MKLVPFWFIVIAVLWTGFFVLEGFDFGVGMLHGVVGKDEAGRRAAINTIGPLWDGNEVWLIVAAAALFAAFPGWYATMFSALYLALVLLLVALIVRGVSFEYRGKRDAVRWRRTWDGLLTAGRLLAPLLLGVALGDLLHGLPINSSQESAGSLVNLLQPYALLTGVTLMLICLLHGATFLSLKTTGDMRERAGRLARRVAPVTGLAVLAFAIWTHVTSSSTFFLNPGELLAVLAAIATIWGPPSFRHFQQLRMLLVGQCPVAAVDRPVQDNPEIGKQDAFLCAQHPEDADIRFRGDRHAANGHGGNAQRAPPVASPVPDYCEHQARQDKKGPGPSIERAHQADAP